MAIGASRRYLRKWLERGRRIGDDARHEVTDATGPSDHGTGEAAQPRPTAASCARRRLPAVAAGPPLAGADAGAPQRGGAARRPSPPDRSAGPAEWAAARPAHRPGRTG